MSLFIDLSKRIKRCLKDIGSGHISPVPIFCEMFICSMLLLGACGTASTETKNTGAAAEPQITEEAAGAQAQEPESGTAVGTAETDGVSYAYEQELNVIEDNYRNYYEIFVYSFYDSDGDGIGDLNGVIQKLDYIADMGFNGIWLMPVMPSPTYHKYDVTDYYGIDEQYGSAADFQALLDACHERNIRVVIDMVINHTSSEHEWFETACDYLRTLEENEEPDLSECPYAGYYHFAKEQVNGSYYPVSGSGWYYEGVFWSEMPDLNLENAALRQELEKIASYWLEMGVDGFRMDAAMHFEESDTAFNTEVLNWLYSYCKGINPDFYMVSEVWAAEGTIADYYESETPSMFNFDLADSEGKLIKAARGKLDAAGLVTSMLAYQEDFSAAYPEYIDAPFITNHDMGRVCNALVSDENDLKMAGGLLMTMNGSPFVYYGEEIGMKSKGTKDENKRLPMYWSDTDTDGMTAGPADADEGITSSFAGAEEQIADETSILNYYKRALRLRNENPEIARGTITKVDALCDGHQAAILKTWEESTIAIVYNTSDEERKVDLSGTELEAMGIRGYLTPNGEEIVMDGHSLSMPGQSICILK